MEQKVTRDKLNKFLRFWYVVLVLILPMISLVASFYVYKGLWTDDSFWGQANFVMYFFFNMPIFVIFTYHIINGYFPKSNRNALYLFIPLVISYSPFFIDNGFKGFWPFVITNSLPIYLGLNLIFYLGLLFLSFGISIGNSFKRLISGLILLILFSALLFYAPIYFMKFGIELHTLDYSGYQSIRSLVVFFFTILLMAVFHFKVAKRVFEQGKLV